MTGYPMSVPLRDEKGINAELCVTKCLPKLLLLQLASDRTPDYCITTITRISARNTQNKGPSEQHTDHKTMIVTVRSYWPHLRRQLKSCRM
ncbi:hypothetical protein EVAR_84399_1 [Eumeta japonica]|uniref:Uncharacterized protein n=1 Tax=Eumeta variegata TaxID=151549 RepID=A0A4C1YIW2_EUMVA|nr:hypothetical protein EVAR_84399_1 [Eumeta japonica]